MKKEKWRWLDDREIGIVKGILEERGRKSKDGKKKNGNKVEEDIYLMRMKREFIMKKGRKGERRENRIINIENGIGEGNWKIWNKKSMERIKEIDKKGNEIEVIVIKKKIKVIGIIVDKMREKKRKMRREIEIEKRKEVIDKREVLRIVDEMKEIKRKEWMEKIKIEIKKRKRMYEEMKGKIELEKWKEKIFEKSFSEIKLRKRS